MRLLTLNWLGALIELLEDLSSIGPAQMLFSALPKRVKGSFLCVGYNKSVTLALVWIRGMKPR